MDEELKAYLEGMEKRLTDEMLHIQREIMDAVESVSTRQTVRLRKLEEEQSNSEYLAQKRRCP